MTDRPGLKADQQVKAANYDERMAGGTKRILPWSRLRLESTRGPRNRAMRYDLSFYLELV